MVQKIAIGTSMRFRSMAKQVIQQLEQLGFKPLFPNIELSEDDRDVAETLEEKARLARDQYAAIEEGDALYLLTPNGYMGTSCKIELGYALGIKKPVYFSEQTGDLSLDCYPKRIIPINQLELFREE